ESVQRQLQDISSNDKLLSNDVNLERLNFKRDSIQNQVSTEEEVEAFMQDFARIQNIEREAERLAAERALVESLSDEAEMIVSWEESTEHLFEDGYFDSLETK